MSPVARVLAVALLVTGGGLAGCGGGDDDSEAATTKAPATTIGPRKLTVCGVEERTDLITDGSSPGGDFAAQRVSAIAYLEEIIDLRGEGQAPREIAADYAAVTTAYEVVRDAFEGTTTPEEYLAEVERLALEAFGSPEEVDRVVRDYSAWVELECGFDPDLGIQLFAN